MPTFAELLTGLLAKARKDRTPRDYLQLSSAMAITEAMLWDFEDLRNAIKGSGLVYRAGQLIAGAGNVRIDKSGIILKGGSQSVNEVKWRQTLDSTTRAFIRGTTDESANAGMTIGVDGESDWTETLTLKSIGTTGDGAWIKIISDASQVGSIGFVVFFPVDTEKTVLTILGDRARFTDPILIKEAAAAVSDETAHGQIWVKSDTPNVLMFTDDAGSDFTVDVTAA